MGGYKSSVRVALGAGVLALAIGIAVPGAPAVASVPGNLVSVWMSNPSTSTWLAPQAQSRFAAAPGTTGSTIVVDPSRTYQTMSGFGASITDTTAYNLFQLSAAKRNQLMQDLFSPTAGIGMSYLRQPIGVNNTDLTRGAFSSLDDNPADESTTNLPSFSIASDKAEVIPLIKQARALNPAIGLMASSWSAPAWMKTNNSLLGAGGSLETSNYGRYATYLAKAVEAYQAEGLAFDTITVQNEPGYGPAGYPGMLMTAAQQRDFIKNDLGPAFASAGITTKILGLDHNWDLQDYPQTIFGDPIASGYTSGTAFHHYGGSVDQQSAIKRSYPDKDIYFTEGSNNSSTTFEYVMRTQMIDVVRNWAKTVILWNIAADGSNGPSSCSPCQPMITVDAVTDSYAYNLDYRGMAHLSKFVKPGAVRIASNSLGATSVDNVAFTNPDGSTALVAYNSASSASTFDVRFGADSFRYTLPAGAAATFTWTGSAGARSINPYGMTQAETATTLSSGLDVQQVTGTNIEYVGFAAAGDRASYSNADFQAGASSITLRVANGGSATSATIRLDAPNTAPIATVAVPPTGSWTTFANVTASLTASVGVHAIYVEFDGAFNLDWFRFDSGIAPAGQLLLEDFEGGTFTGWSTIGGTWSVCTPAGGSKEFCKTDSGTGLASTGSTSWRNYTVESAVIPSDANGTGVAILGRVVDSAHFYQLELKRDAGGVKTWNLYKNDGGTYTQLTGGTVTYTGGNYYYLRMVLNGSSLSAYVSNAWNGPWTYLGSATDGTFASGQAGVRAASTSTRFDLFRVTQGE